MSSRCTETAGEFRARALTRAEKSHPSLRGLVTHLLWNVQRAAQEKRSPRRNDRLMMSMRGRILRCPSTPGPQANSHRTGASGNPSPGTACEIGPGGRAAAPEQSP